MRSWRAAAFAAGILTLAAALASPIDTASEAIFSAHMAQHRRHSLIAYHSPVEHERLYTAGAHAA